MVRRGSNAGKRARRLGTMNTDGANPPEPGEISKFTCLSCGAVFETEADLRKHEETCRGDKVQPRV